MTEIGVQLPEIGVQLPPKSAFNFLRNRCSTSSEKPKRLEGLSYRMARQALLPDERLSDWVLMQATER